MKNLIVVLIIVLVPSISFANNMQTDSTGAFGVGYALEGLQLEFIMQRTVTQSIHFAFASNLLWDGSRGEEKSEQLWNYGQEIEGTGDGFYLFDVGYGYKINPNVRLAAELSFYWKYQYTNYIDGRFKDGGYYMVDNREFKFGIGSTASYCLNNGYEIYTGYNSIKKFNAGIRFRF